MTHESVYTDRNGEYSDVSSEMEYDGIGRLTQKVYLSGSDRTERYVFDNGSNISSCEVTENGDVCAAGSAVMQYDAQNRLIYKENSELRYDADGDLTGVYSSADGSEEAQYIYDGSNRLIRADDISYTYDAEGYRCGSYDEKTGNTTLYTYAYTPYGTQLVMTEDASRK